MANIKIQQLTEKTSANDNDVLIIEDASTTSKIKISNLLKEVKTHMADDTSAHGINNKEDKAVESMINLYVGNGWVAFDISTFGTPSCYKDRDRVYLRGSVDGSNSSINYICNLPADYRPAHGVFISTSNTDIAIWPDGNISVNSNFKGVVRLDVVSFRVGV